MPEQEIEGVLAQWGHAHEMTLAFLDAVPDEYWFTPHERFAPLAKQMRHVVGVRGVYTEALTTAVSTSRASTITTLVLLSDSPSGAPSRPATRRS
jgi:hypothetical protein